MFSYIAYNHGKSSESTNWQTSGSIRNKGRIKNFSLGAEILVIGAAIALLVLSQQSWPQGFWLTHSATFISSCVSLGLGSMDILIASIIALSRLKMNTPQSAQSDWQKVTFAGKKTYHEEFKASLEKLGIDPSSYKLVIFRAGNDNSYLYGSADATAADFGFKIQPDDNPHNLSNYTPDQVMVVTHYCNNDVKEERVMKRPFNSSNTNQRFDFWNKCTYIHMNSEDLYQLQKNQVSDSIIQAIQKHQTWKDPQFN